ncbi:MAG: hypothetical protein DWQ45_24460 [Planctomycetota bacterium]|nr:MAG: hypothetical protein DWQ41_22690 [Planctomycetota bacterium]REK28525.1 MAG: hypothetical protein DWQ45_24460 [Planctomycetota bacterium]
MYDRTSLAFCEFKSDLPELTTPPIYVNDITKCSDSDNAAPSIHEPQVPRSLKIVGRSSDFTHDGASAACTDFNRTVTESAVFPPHDGDELISQIDGDCAKGACLV